MRRKFIIPFMYIGPNRASSGRSVPPRSLSRPYDHPARIVSHPYQFKIASTQHKTPSGSMRRPASSALLQNAPTANRMRILVVNIRETIGAPRSEAIAAAAAGEGSLDMAIRWESAPGVSIAIAGRRSCACRRRAAGSCCPPASRGRGPQAIAAPGQAYLRGEVFTGDTVQQQVRIAASFAHSRDRRNNIRGGDAHEDAGLGRVAGAL